jgi:hypothetical protein
VAQKVKENQKEWIAILQSTLFEKDSLRFVPCRSRRGCDTRSAQRVNSNAPVVGIYDQTDFASADAKLCEGGLPPF